jgi:predicted dehydrogenase
MEFTGNKGKMTVPVPFKPGKHEEVNLEIEDKVQHIQMKGLELYSGEILDMENAIMHGEPPRISLNESRRNVMAIEALYKSAHQSKSVTI